MLKGYLPQFMVDKKIIYGILSKGIHELSEKECLDFFDTLRESITLILEQKIAQKGHEDAIENVQKSLGKISSYINQK